MNFDGNRVQSRRGNTDRQTTDGIKDNTNKKQGKDICLALYNYNLLKWILECFLF